MDPSVIQSLGLSLRPPENLYQADGLFRAAGRMVIVGAYVENRPIDTDSP